MAFRHHPDGWIYIGDFTATLAEFVAQRPAYALAAPWTGRVYDGRRHVLTDGRNQSRGSEPWPDGDEYLANAAAIQAAIVATRPGPPPPPSRVPRQVAAIYQDIRNLTNADQAKVFAAVAAFVLQQSPGLARAVGIALDGDESA